MTFPYPITSEGSGIILGPTGPSPTIGVKAAFPNFQGFRRLHRYLDIIGIPGRKEGELDAGEMSFFFLFFFFKILVLVFSGLIRLHLVFSFYFYFFFLVLPFTFRSLFIYLFGLFVFLEPHLQHMEVPRLGVQLEL